MEIILLKNCSPFWRLKSLVQGQSTPPSSHQRLVPIRRSTKPTGTTTWVHLLGNDLMLCAVLSAENLYF